MEYLESPKRCERLAQKKSRIMGLAYEKIVQRVAQALKDIAKNVGETLTAAELNAAMYGDRGVLTEAVEYGRLHSAN